MRPFPNADFEEQTNQPGSP